MKFCDKCGAKTIDNANFCNKCGAPLKKENNSNTPDSKSISDDDIKKPLNTNNTIEEPNSNDSDSSNPKKRNKLIISIVVLLVIIGGALFFSKDFILYHHYYNSAADESNIQNKLTSYNKALALNYNPEILNNIYDILRKDSNFQKDLNLVTNLKKSDKQNIIYKICTLNSTECYNNGNYEKALKYYNIAKSNGCNLKNFPNGEALSENSNDTTNYNNNSPTSDKNLNARIQSKDEYIEPNSNSTYLKENNLKKYDKKTLALVRNEIYARYGYVFHTEPFKSYFSSKSWYIQNPSFQGKINDLNEYEQKNVQLLQKLENE
ncbi:YARHG domain-containing protein [Eubacterium multiforme]|uniref:YARHG domain-containing protein n=1 Tax=Eubacterium multiforme TaxID=83339 RepID=A0ABT9UT76_9FIRM|nr:YARHG domain-containing protein [Eubacterium multiforme]MDQ0149517.1 hypothetical protein [Eubacterium multiforme]